MNTIGPYVAVDVLCVIIAWAIGSGKGHPGFGAFLGLFGPLGILVIALQTPTPAIQAVRLEAVEAERARLRAEAAGPGGASVEP